MNAFRFFVLSAAVLLLAACPSPIGLDSGAPAIEPPAAEAGPRVETDAARGQAVYVNETGERFDVVAVDDAGSEVACAEAVDIAVMDPEPEAALPPEANASAAAPGPGLKAVIAGRRADGSYALWAVLRDDTIHVVFCTEGDGRDPALPECGERNGWLRGWMGWKYYVTGTATDGITTIVVGYAENARGFRHGRWAVEPGTTVAMYWKVIGTAARPRCAVTPARVIGVRDPAWHPPWRRHRGEPRGWLRGLKLFLDGYFASYLTMATGVAWDAAAQVFVVPGTNEEGNPAEATMDRQGRIAITEVQGEKPDLTVEAPVVPVGPIHAGQTWQLSATVGNAGAGAVAAIAVRFSLSADAVLDAADTVAGEVSIASLEPGASKDAVLSDTFSLSVPGTRWIFVTVDPGDVIDEENEGNNQASASVAVLYERLVIDTYKPTGGGQGGTTDTFLSLFDARGTNAPAMLEDNDSNPVYFRAARIDYAKPSGILPGTVFYVRVRAGVSGASGRYAIRLVTSDPDTYGAGWFFGATDDEALYEPDEAMNNGRPEHPALLPVGGKLNRALAAGDVDWVKLVLP